MIVTNTGSHADIMNSLANEDLMVSYSRGDAEAFETLYQRNKTALFRYLLRQLDQVALAEEFAHEVWLRVIRSRHSYEPKAKFTTYLFQIAHNHLVDHFRKSAKVKEVNIEDSENEVQDSIVTDDPESSIDREKQRQIMLALIRELPGEQREVFLLKEEGNLSIDEIAQVVNENTETVKSRMRYAVKKLRDGMQPYLQV